MEQNITKNQQKWTSIRAKSTNQMSYKHEMDAAPPKKLESWSKSWTWIQTSQETLRVTGHHLARSKTLG